MAAKLQAVRGMNDLLPAASPRWRGAEQRLQAVLARYGYEEIRLPLVEPTELFARTIGEVTDIVEKEMYTFLDRNGDSLTLRPEGTAGVVRAGIEHGLFQGQLLRLWYQGPMFRHERPQRGRYRQFHQIGAECFGSAEPELDAELIAMTAQFWRELGLSGLRLEINSLGSREARAAYRERLLAYFRDHHAALDDDSLRRLDTNPLRILDSKNPDLAGADRRRAEPAGAPGRRLAGAFRAPVRAAGRLGVAYTVNPRLVRGLDYYGRTVFEWVTDALGAQGTVCAGGRYDTLVEQLGGRADAGHRLRAGPGAPARSAGRQRHRSGHARRHLVPGFHARRLPGAGPGARPASCARRRMPRPSCWTTRPATSASRCSAPTRPAPGWR